MHPDPPTALVVHSPPPLGTDRRPLGLTSLPAALPRSRPRLGAVEARGGIAGIRYLHAWRATDESHGEGRRRQLTPRTADLLHTALVVLADQAYDDAQHLGDRSLFDAGPAAAEVFDRLSPLTWTAGHRWRRRMARAFDDLADDLVRGQIPTPACTAEKTALRLALEDVPGHLEDLCEEDDHHALPRHEDDYDYSLLNWFTAERDARRPAAWFTPYDDCSGRDPRRGFRR
ncbi:hypothetical protein ACIA8H_32795 [Streptomyces goshikiensis]|uniref:hypothetical protein n=1 Tax=Streptomyces goshikiensis TaxID=1942 RepID=UPI0037882DC9